MILIGETKGIPVYLREDEGMNRHITIWGKSGSGKSVAQQSICCKIVKAGGTVLALDIHGVLSSGNIYSPLKQIIAENSYAIDAYSEGIPANLFKPATFEDWTVERYEDTAAAICDVIDKTVKLGVRQRVALQRAAQYVLEEALYEKKGLAALGEGLRIQKTETAENLADKLSYILERRIFVSGNDAEFIQEGKLNVVRLSKFDDKTQALAAELLLSYLWRRVLSGELKNLYIVIDEFQNLAFKKGSALEKFLVEGRKYGIGLILATQGLGINFSNAQQRLLLQSGIQLYFKPAENEIRDVAKILGGGDFAPYSMLLYRLEVGECIAVGPLQLGDKGDIANTTPTKIRIKI